MASSISPLDRRRRGSRLRRLDRLRSFHVYAPDAQQRRRDQRRPLARRRPSLGTPQTAAGSSSAPRRAQRRARRRRGAPRPPPVVVTSACRSTQHFPTNRLGPQSSRGSHPGCRRPHPSACICTPTKRLAILLAGSASRGGADATSSPYCVSVAARILPRLLLVTSASPNLCGNQTPSSASPCLRLRISQ